MARMVRMMQNRVTDSSDENYGCDEMRIFHTATGAGRAESPAVKPVKGCQVNLAQPVGG